MRSALEMTRLYEIRLVGQGAQAVSIFRTFQPDDRAAISRARRLDADCGIEVWRGMDCVYSEAAGKAA